MESQLQQMLRSLCFNTGWKYAIFWKLQHQEQMILTWEDAYYDGTLYPYKKFFIETAHSLKHDLLGLAVANMSNQVYSLGEGIVGQVTVSGKHSWIYSDKHVANFCSTSEVRGALITVITTGRGLKFMNFCLIMRTVVRSTVVISISIEETLEHETEMGDMAIKVLMNDF